MCQGNPSLTSPVEKGRARRAVPKPALNPLLTLTKHRGSKEERKGRRGAPSLQKTTINMPYSLINEATEMPPRTKEKKVYVERREIAIGVY
jgi:hypothetical protein